MTAAIVELYANLPDSDLPSRQVAEYVKFAQGEAFFHLAVAKHSRVNALKAGFQEAGLRKVYLSAYLAWFECRIPGFDVEILEKGFFAETDPARLQEKQALLKDCLVIVNNNDASAPDARIGYASLYASCASTCFVVWDWDNHHWLELSTFLAAHSDIYAPAHHENLYVLSRYNWLIAGPVYCSSVQWSRKFLTENLAYILNVERSTAPLGMHIPYAQFSFRMQVISTLSQRYSSIGFSNRTFHDRTPADKLSEWCAHKTHWIAPVLNDVPIRIFDALVTGGIPIVPESMRLLPPISSISRDHIVFYSGADVVNPLALVDRANRMFDEAGRDGMVARHRFALDHHHGDASVRAMLRSAADVFGLTA